MRFNTILVDMSNRFAALSLPQRATAPGLPTDLAL
jgi:hypothetical protein